MGTALEAIFGRGGGTQRANAAAPARRGGGYVPDGLTASDYQAVRGREAQKKQANKKKFPLVNMGTDVKVWLQQMEKDQKVDDRGNFIRSGHTFAKQKYDDNGSSAKAR